MKKIARNVIGLSVFLMAILCIPVYAANDSMLMPDNIRVSEAIIMGAQRSSTLARALSDITNEGYGAIGVRGETDLYQDVPWAKLTLYLQRRETEGATTGWITEVTLEEEFENVHVAEINEVIYGQPSGYYYRVKTFHEVESEENGYESKTSVTDGIMITNP